MLKKMMYLSFSLIMILSYSGTALADSSSELSTYTKEQQADIEKGKKETKILQEELESGKAANKVVPDKKALEDKSSLAAAASSVASSRKGTFYVTSDATSSNSSAWAGGHAAMVYSQYYTVEAWGNQGAALNGVNLWSNNWKTKYNHFQAMSTSGTTVSEDAAAGDKAFSYSGKVPYNFNFFNINQDDSFYCSQLVWYAYDKTVDLDLNDGGAVWPVDLTQSSHTYSFYTQ